MVMDTWPEGAVAATSMAVAVAVPRGPVAVMADVVTVVRVVGAV